MKLRLSPLLSLTTLATLGLVAAKGIVGTRFDSDLLLADALHSGADLVAIFASWIGLRIAARKKTERFPYGYYKAETFSVLIISAFILWASVELFQEGVHKLFERGGPGSLPVYAMLVSALSAVCSLGIAIYEKRIALRIGSSSLLANAKESFLDVAASAVVFAGILLHAYNVPYVEGVVILGIAAMIAKLGLENVWKAFMVLMDADLDRDLAREITEEVASMAGVKSVKSVKIRTSGITHFVDLTFSTNRSVSLQKAHAMADKVESHIVETYKTIESVFIHIEPVQEDTLTVAVPVEEAEGMTSRLNPHFAKAPYFAIVEKRGEAFEIVRFAPNEHRKKLFHMGTNISKILLGHRIDVLITERIGEISYHWLGDNCIDIYRTRAKTLGEALDAFREGRLERLATATHTCDLPGTAGAAQGDSRPDAAEPPRAIVPISAYSGSGGD